MNQINHTLGLNKKQITQKLKQARNQQITNILLELKEIIHQQDITEMKILQEAEKQQMQKITHDLMKKQFEQFIQQKKNQ